MAGEIMESGITARQLVVLVAVGDAARAEHLSASLAATEDLLPVVTGSGVRADVVITDEALSTEAAGNAVMTPQVLLSARPDLEKAAGPIFAVLPAGADHALIAAAARLAAAGYRVSSDSGAVPDRHDGFHDAGGDGLFDEDHPDDDAGARPALSPREAEVLALLAEGAPNKVIARRLNISVHTAKFHVAAILIKLGAANRTDAIAIAMRQGLVLV
nr:helix-turn-helix transcriptional regulator [Mesorhizobium sp. INR15]